MNSVQIKRTLTGSEPITVSDMKAYLKVDYATDDTLIGSLITAARQSAENYCNRSYAVQNIEYNETDFQSPVKLPYPNHSAIETVTVNGSAATYGKVGLTQFIVSVSSYTATTSDIALPSELYIKYSTTGEISEDEKTILKKIVAEMYETRSTTLSENAMVYLLPYKVY